MGTEATSYYFEEVASHTQANKDQDHIDTIILNAASLPDRTQAILSGETDELMAQLVEHAQTLEKLEVANIAIPCNTSHYFYEELQAKTNVPIIHMVRETVQAAIDQFEGKKIGIMATTGTINSGIYHKECERLGVEAIVPSADRQDDVMSLIYDDIKKGQKADAAKFQRAYDDLVEKGSDVVILACTELSVFKKTHEIPANCLDAMDVLVRESIERSNAVYR